MTYSYFTCEDRSRWYRVVDKRTSKKSYIYYTPTSFNKRWSDTGLYYSPEYILKHSYKRVSGLYIVLNGLPL